MGSITSRPQVPSQPQTVFVPQTVAPSTGTTNTSDSSGVETSQEVAALSRTQSLLQRERGRFGTIQTGFRGLLSLGSNSDAGRKTLLGESRPCWENNYG